MEICRRTCFVHVGLRVGLSAVGPSAVCLYIDGREGHTCHHARSYGLSGRLFCVSLSLSLSLAPALSTFFY